MRRAKKNPNRGDNVFELLGFPDAAERSLKADIAIAIIHVIRERGLTQAKASNLMGTDQARVSRLMTGHLDKFSVEWLLGALNALGQNVRIEHSKAKTKVGHTEVEAR